MSKQLHSYCFLIKQISIILKQKIHTGYKKYFFLYKFSV